MLQDVYWSVLQMNMVGFIGILRHAEATAIMSLIGRVIMKYKYHVAAHTMVVIGDSMRHWSPIGRNLASRTTMVCGAHICI